LPAGPIEGVDDGVRTEYQSNAAEFVTAPTYTQLLSSRDGGSRLSVETRFGAAPPLAADTTQPIAIAGWDEALFVPARSGGGLSTDYVILRARWGHLELAANGLSDDELIEVARSIAPRPAAAPGWALRSPTTPVSLHDNWDRGAIGTASRNIDWYGDNQLTAEITIAEGAADLFDSGFGDDISVVDVDGSPTEAVQLNYSTGPITIVSWVMPSDVVVSFGVAQPLDQAVAIARSISPVDRATWESVSRQPRLAPDGCNSFRC
jgi:hypothetical protein